MSMTYGASPAFFLSLYGDGFTPAQVCEGLGILAGLGADCYQAEIVHESRLAAWLDGGARRVRETAAGEGLAMSQMVAHFMLDAFASPAALESDWGLAQMERVIDIADLLADSRQITVPMGAFQGEKNAANRAKLADKLRRVAKRLHGAGYRMALEVQPGALVAGGEAIRALALEIGWGTGYNFDTGHAFASGCADVATFPTRFGGLLYGTHLCDNDGATNDSHRPGTGGIDWARLLRALREADYQGSYDLEIFCPKADVPAQYGAGYAYLRKHLEGAV